MKPIRLLSSLLTVSGWTLISRIAGFVRDILIARFLGAGPIAEAFLVAFSLPNMFRRFFAEGAMNAAFVPAFSKKLEAKDDPRGFASDVFSALAVILIVFSLIAIVAMPLLVAAMASGFIGDERFELSVIFGRIAFPYILFISLAALLSGVLNATGRFAAAAAAPVLLNLLFIGALLIGANAGWPLGLTLAWTVPFAGIAQLMLLWLAAKRAGFSPEIRRPRLSPEIRKLARIAFPAALAGGVVQVNLLIGRQIASLSAEGAIAWLNYADRLYQLPLGVVGIAIGIVLLPDLSRRLRAEDHAGANSSFNRSAEMALLLTLPAMAAFMVIGPELVRGLFERGAFSTKDTEATSLALFIYAIGLPAFVLQKLYLPLFLAREDTKTPFRYALWCMLINFVIAVGLMPFISWPAAAMGTTLSAWAMLFLLIFGSTKMGGAASIDSRLRSRFPRILMATSGMSLVLWSITFGAENFFPEIGNSLLLLILVLLGCISYFAFAFRLRALSPCDFRSSFRRSKP